MITEKAYAKLNISLDVSGIRDDGYHELVMIMQTIDVCDDIQIDLNDTGIIYSKSNLPFIPNDDRNLAVKAARLYLEQVGKTDLGAVITLDKDIPTGAGMAGGSADASAVLRALNREFNHLLDDEQLLRISEKVGSDVPYCTLGGTALAKGRGEVLKSLKDFPDCEIVVAKPEFSISTPELFKAIDSVKLKTHPDTNGIIRAIEDEKLEDICRRMYNVFETVPDRRMRVVSEIKRQLFEAGAHGAIMTGTGSAVFGVFDTGTIPNTLQPKLEKEYGFCRVAKPVNRLL